MSKINLAGLRAPHMHADTLFNITSKLKLSARIKPH